MFHVKHEGANLTRLAPSPWLARPSTVSVRVLGLQRPQRWFLLDRPEESVECQLDVLLP